IHPDRATLLVSTDGFLDRDQLMCDWIPFLTEPHLQGAAVNIFDDMDLALVLGKRQPPRAVSQSPLPRVIIDRKADEFNERRARSALRFVFIIGSRRRPYSSQVDLSE